MSLVFSLLIIALMIGAVVDIMTRENSQVRFLPKMAWLVIVILLPLIGGILWFTLGREYSGAGIRIPRPSRQRLAPQARTEVPPARPVDTRTTEQQIEDLDREIEEWRLRSEIEKRSEVDDRKRDQPPAPES